jgi:hypothetical protein
MPDPEPIHHPTTGEPIALGPGEQLQRIAWHGAPVVVVTRPGPAASRRADLSPPALAALSAPRPRRLPRVRGGGGGPARSLRGWLRSGRGGPALKGPRSEVMPRPLL